MRWKKIYKKKHKKKKKKHQTIVVCYATRPSIPQSQPCRLPAYSRNNELQHAVVQWSLRLTPFVWWLLTSPGVVCPLWGAFGVTRAGYTDILRSKTGVRRVYSSTLETLPLTRENYSHANFTLPWNMRLILAWPRQNTAKCRALPAARRGLWRSARERRAYVARDTRWKRLRVVLKPTVTCDDVLFIQVLTHSRNSVEKSI